jgi:hypothetical protein
MPHLGGGEAGYYFTIIMKRLSTGFYRKYQRLRATALLAE